MRRALLALVLIAAPSVASAATYYVDNSCTFNGNGTGNNCAASGGASGAFNSASALQTLLSSTVVADDIVLIKNGTYATTNDGGDTSVNGGFTIGASGTSGHPITIMNYPGHSPILTNCPLAQATYCARPTITAPNRQYVQVKSNTSGTLVIKGGLWIYGVSEHPSDTGSLGMVFSHLEVYEGWGEADDGNLSAFFIDGQDGVQIDHNYIHDVTITSGGGSQSSGAAIKLYYNSDSIIEYNTIQRVFNGQSTAVGGIDDKEHAKRNIYRFNWIEDVANCFRWNSQLGATNHEVEDSEFYGNVCIGWTGGSGIYGFRLDSAVGTGNKVYNNTFYRFTTAWNNNTLSVDPDVQWYNNIFDGGGQAVTENVELYNYAIFGTPSNYNAWVTGKRWLHNGTSYANLAAWQATGFDANSHTTACTFTSAPTNLKVVSGTCLTGGKTGGTSGGSTIEQGAYGVTTCVGYTCGGAAAAAPTVTSASPATGGTGGGTTITITGADFVATPTITVGGVTCSGPSFTNSTTISCTTGAHAAGAVDIIVTNPDAQAGTGTNAFTYTIPAATVYRIRFK